MRIEVTGRDRSIVFDCPGDREILLAGLGAGFGLPYECGNGSCANCKATLIEGDVDPGWVDAPASRLLKTDGNEILMCQARPLTACSLSVRAKLPIELARPQSNDAYFHQHSNSQEHQLQRDHLVI